MKLRGFSMLALSLCATFALAQAQSPPTAPRVQSPAQAGSTGQQGSQPGQGQPGQPASPIQLQQGRGAQGGQQPGGQRTANFRGGDAGSQMIDGHLAACLIL